jgi:type 1 glutamine amidotransferase
MLKISHTPLSPLKHFRFLTLFLLFSTCFLAEGLSQVNWKKVNVLVYTRNGKGYVHDNIPAAVACITELGKKYGFGVTVSDTPVVFTSDNLKKYTMLVFTSTNNDVFDTDLQRLAFRKYIEAGGGFVGLHSVMGTERNWTWFKNMMGGTFAWHARNQVFTVKTIKPKHPSMKGVPLVWEKKDECYFGKELYPGIEVLMAHDITTLNKDQAAEIAKNAGTYSVLYPAVWYHAYDGGHIWITTLGHDIPNYTEPVYVNHVLQGIQFIATKVQKLNLEKAYATDRDAPLQF